MANNADGQIVFNVQIDDSTVQEQVRETTQEIERVGEAAEESGKKINTAGSEGGKGLELLKTGAGIAAGAVVAVGAAAVGAAAEAVKLSDDLAKAMNGFSSATGLSVEETKKYEDVLKNVYKNNYGESFEDISQTMSIINQRMGELPTEELQKATEYAYLLSDTFGMDIDQSVNGVNAMMKQFGISSKDAYNLIAQGAQQGLNQNGDLTDQIAEYSVYFADMGLGAEDMFNTMVSGVKSGVYQLDYLNDAMKELGIKTKDNSDATKDAFAKLGLNAEELTASFAQGGDAAMGAMAVVNKALFETKDEVAKNEMGVALYGTKWEDSGKRAVEAMANVGDSISTTNDVLGEMETTKYNDLGSMLEGLKRNFELLLLPLGDALIPLIKELIQNGIIPLGDKFKDILPKLTDMAVNALPILVDAFSNVYDIVSSIISEALPYLKDLFEQLQPSFQIFTDELLPKITQLFFSLLEPIMTLVDTFLPIIIDLFNTFAPILLDIANAIMPILIDVFNTFLPIISDLITNLLPPLKELFKSIAPLIEALSPAIKAISEMFGDVLGMAIEAVTPLLEGIIGSLTNLIEFVSNVFSGNWEAAWKNIVDNFKMWFGIIPEFLEDVINMAISGINTMINQINETTAIVGIDAIPKIGYIDIPTFHTGGIIDFSGKKEGLINAMGGEMVLTASQQKRLFEMANGRGYNSDGGDTNNSVVNMYITNNVRDDIDIEKINQELKKLSNKNLRSMGM
jgi:phage-related minor tail protein